MKSTTASSLPKAGDIALWITYVNIVLYALCYQLQRPVEPYLIKSLTAEHPDPKIVSQYYGRLEAFFSAIQTFGSPLVGILLDRVGIRKTSALVFLSSALSYGILSQANTMSMLFLSKVPTALQHAFLVAQATAATSTGTDPAARAQALGRMTTAYTGRWMLLLYQAAVA
jgi:MFS transporter, OCT family, solute carrier family 22 (organic cation transporter), member 18